jgi:hypothetical protein
MFKTSSILAAFLAVVTCSTAYAQDYSVETIDEAPDAEEVSDEIAELIAEQGVRVKRGSTRTVCELWFCKQWNVDADFEATSQRLYPFTPGQLIGLLHFSRRGSEFRDQAISSGWYTLRFALQPVDGNHVGTSPTRDFFLLVDAERDELPENWEMDALNESSAEAAGSSHPAMLCLQRATEGSELALRHDEQHDWWILHLVGQGKAGEKTIEIPIDLVVVGHAEE